MKTRDFGAWGRRRLLPLPAQRVVLLSLFLAPSQGALSAAAHSGINQQSGVTEPLDLLSKAHQVHRYRRRDHRGRDRGLRARQLELWQRRVRSSERGDRDAAEWAEPAASGWSEPASRRSDPGGLASQVGNNHQDRKSVV